MNTVLFSGANDVIGRPRDTTADQCGAAIVHRGTDARMGVPVITSCWQLSPEEMEEVKRTGKIYLRLFSPVIPMMSVSVENPVLEKWVEDGVPGQPDHPLLAKN